MAERNGGTLRRVLLSADCLSDSAILWGSSQVKTPFSRSSALLSLVTLPDQRLTGDDLNGFGIAASLFIFYFLMVDVLSNYISVSYTHLRAHETVLDLVCRLLLEKKKK